MAQGRLVCRLVPEPSVLARGQVMVLVWRLVVGGRVMVWALGGLYLGVEFARFGCRNL